MLALFAGILPACDRTATDAEEAASRGATSGQTPSGGATGQRNEKNGVCPYFSFGASRIGRIGRTSTLPICAGGMREAIWIASLRSRASIM